MGYYTTRTLSVYKDGKELSEEETQKHAIAISEFAGEDTNGETEDALFSGASNKWYDQDIQMMEYSKLCPGLLFEIDCEGEESPDFHRDYYKEGKRASVVGEIVYGKFKESMLQ
jgi:hypothetical protein